jgi:hypothetical protein
MNHSGDAAEQIVRMSLEGVEVAARITGTAAKEIALMLLAALKSPERGSGDGIKPRGRERLNSMLKSGKALEIFSVKESDLRTFVREAKRYGIVYCVLRNSRFNASKTGGLAPDGLCDIMVKADDAPKINRLVERFKFATVDKAKIESEILRDMDAKITEPPDGPADAEPDEPERNDIDSLLDELFGTIESQPAPESEKTEPEEPGPGAGKASDQTKDGRPEPDPLASGGDSLTAADRSPPPFDPPPKLSLSEPSSESRKNERHTSSKSSVKKELREIAAAKKAVETDARKREEPVAAKPRETQTTTHTQPINRRKHKKLKVR